MRGQSTHFDRASVRAVSASRRFKWQTDASLSSAAAEARLMETALALNREKVESGIVASVRNRDQWGLLGETASANVGAPLFKTDVLISISGAVEHLYQPSPSHAFECWGASPSPSVFGRRQDWPFVGAYGQEYQYSLLYVTCPADVTVSTFTLPVVTLEGLYQIEDSKAVTEFLAHNAFLRDLLVEAHDKIVEFFGEDADVHLELYEDPDFRADRQLYAVIFTPLAAKDAIPIQERFDDAWWLDNLAKAHGKFNIIVEYV
jgi:hypothetical protein